MKRQLRALIDTAALRHNLETIRSHAKHAKVMAVIKANAYGHGLVPTARALSSADAFAVARLEEGIELREAGVHSPIVLLEGVFTAEQLGEAARHRFELVVHDPLQVELLETYRGTERFVLWVKVDTGMNRLGFRPEAFAPALARVRALTVSPKEVRVMTHLARSDEPADPMTALQLEKFGSTLAAVGGRDGIVTSIGNSAAILGSPAAHGNWVRPGLALYGVSPFANETAGARGLKPVMTLQSTVLTVRCVKRDETVGYAGAWRAPRDSTVAIVGVGYGDGLPRSLANGTPVLVNGTRCALVGRVSMDMIAVDVTGASNVATGDTAVIWGEGLPVEEVASHAGTIPYELLCGVNQRVPLEYSQGLRPATENAGQGPASVSV